MACRRHRNAVADAGVWSRGDLERRNANGNGGQDFTYTDATPTPDKKRSPRLLPQVAQIYTTNTDRTTGDSTIRVHDLQANGNIKAVWQISGLKDARDIQVSEGRIGVANCGMNAIAVYKASDMEDVSPLWNIAGQNSPRGVFVHGQEIYVANQREHDIAVYDWVQGSTNGKPQRTISDADLGSPAGICVDDKYLYATSPSGKSIRVYDKTQSCAMKPVKEICGSNTQLAEPVALFVVNGETWVCDSGDNSVKVYNGFGNVAPARVIRGDNSGLNKPGGIWVQDAEVYVCNAGADSITIYNLADNGNIAPRRTIQGKDTGLSQPSGICVTRNLSAMQVTAEPKGALVEWLNTSADVVGFHLWRTNGADENSIEVTPHMIPANATGRYIYLDSNAFPKDSGYRYRLQVVNRLQQETWDQSAILDRQTE